MKYFSCIALFGLVSLWIGMNCSPLAYAAATDDFVITVKTDNPGTSSLTQFTIPTYPGETYNYNVDCNDDGTNEAVAQTGDYTCEYAATGTYTIRIQDNSGAGTGFPRIYFNSAGFKLHNDAQKLLTIAQWGTGKWTSMSHAFEGCWAMRMTAADSPDLSGVTDLSYMFANSYLFNGDIGNWNTSKVTNMQGMFYGVDSFNQPIGSWNTANVTNMSVMFANTYAFNQPIGAWNTSNVTDMSYMFNGARAFNQPIGDWNTSNVTDMRYTFGDTWVFNQDIGNWNTAKVTDMRGMFYWAGAFNQPIGAWNIANVENTNRMFWHATEFNQNLENWNTSNIADMREMFAFAGAFNGNIENWNTANVTTMRGMFVSARAFNQPIGNWDISNVIDTSGMFYDASAFNQDIGRWNTGSVLTMSGMFKDTAAFNQDIGNWNTANVIEMVDMFQFAEAFNQDLGSWKIGRLNTAEGMFYGATISTVNYDALLNGWGAQKLRKGVKFDGGNSHYCNGEAARTHLIDSTRWQLKDGGKLCGNGLRIIKKVTAFKRSTHRYKLRVTNRSATLPYLNVAIQDKLPKGYVITDISGNTATCSQNGRTITCTQTQLDPGMSIAVKIWATSNGATGKNCATVTSSTPDPDLQDNKACVAVP